MVWNLMMLLVDGMSQGIKWLQSIELFYGVSVWAFVIGCIVIGVTVSGLLNLVNRPPIGDQVSDVKSDRRRERMRQIRQQERERRR